MRDVTRKDTIMAEHVLMTCATRRPFSTVPALPDDIRYDPERGYWIKAGTPLVITEEFLDGGLNTKKCDQETGEDQKGE